MSQYQNIQTSDIIVDALIDWDIKVIFGLPGMVLMVLWKRYVKDKIRLNLFLSDTKNLRPLWHVLMLNILKIGRLHRYFMPWAIHLLNGLYDAKLDNTPVIAITGRTYSDLMGSGYQQDVDQLQ